MAIVPSKSKHENMRIFPIVHAVNISFESFVNAIVGMLSS